MSTTVATSRLPSTRLAPDAILRAAVKIWFAVLVTSQAIFATTIILFYGLTALRGDTHAWNKRLAHGYVAGDTIGNAALVIHIASAFLILVSGAMQFAPAVRRKAPRLHRWNGRFYMTTAFVIALAGLYMLLARGTPTSSLQESATAMLAVVLMACAFMAWRCALRQEFAAHRRWALRLFLVVSSTVFIRAGVVLSGMIAAGQGSFDVTMLQGQILTILSFGQFALPLAVVQCYFWTETHGRAAARLAMAVSLVVLSLTLGAGIAAASVGIFLPEWRAAFDRRPSIAETMSPIVSAQGVQAAIAQYRALRTANPNSYNFDEDELNSLGYQMLRAHQYKNAVAILALNAQSYPKSANVWDSLGEAYMDDGNTPDAIANYHRSLALNPANRNARVMLAKMGAQ